MRPEQCQKVKRPILPAYLLLTLPVYNADLLTRKSHRLRAPRTILPGQSACSCLKKVARGRIKILVSRMVAWSTNCSESKDACIPTCYLYIRNPAHQGSSALPIVPAANPERPCLASFSFLPLTMSLGSRGPKRVLLLECHFGIRRRLLLTILDR